MRRERDVEQEEAALNDPILELREVSKVYSNEQLQVAALKSADLRIEEGEYAVIMGPSGSGKSTLLNILGCLDRISSGRYFLGGEDVSGLDDDALSAIRSRRIGFIFQSYNLIPQLNVLENIEVPLFYQNVSERQARIRATEIADRLGLGARLRHKPSELSGGQQQRVAIARSLVSSPLMILADEPTGNLDSATGDEILHVIDELNAEGKTIVMVTHDDEIAHRAHRIVRLKDGEIVSNELSEPSAGGRAKPVAGGTNR
ncbi:ABC transporter ATP-binding protein [Candidatus Sumerlaeota bacterium]|nr:ABC transporter ATP-binding protein [Candidatus Sumerlaeota bacterium]